METWLIAILPLAGVALGAALQFWFTRSAERDKHTDSLRSQAYVDYLRAVAAAAHRKTDGSRDALRDAADAKARIAVYGSAAVIRALARFEQVGPVLTPGASSEAFISLVTNMRSGGEAIDSRDLQAVLLGTAQQAAASDERRQAGARA